MEDVLLGKARVDQLHQGVHGLFLVGAIGNDADGDTAHNAQAEHAEKALGVYAPLFLLHPDGRLELVSLLDKEGSRTGMEADLILDQYFFSTHANSLSYRIDKGDFCRRKKWV